MAIDSISFSANSIANATRQFAENRQAEEARQAERPESRAQESARRKAEEGPKPVVNALGQTTGTLINIAA